MKQSRLIVLSIFLLIAFALNGAEKIAGWEISSQDPLGEVEFDPQTGVLSAPKGVKVKYNNVILTADKVTAAQDTGQVKAEGNVTIRWAAEGTNGVGNIWTGEQASYNFKTRELTASDFRTGRFPYYMKAAELAGNQTNEIYVLMDSMVTADDYAEPFFKVRAKRLTLVPNELYEAEHATLYAGNLPIFYFPYYKRILRHHYNLEFTPGYRSSYGPFLLTTYRFDLSEKIQGGLHFDLRQKRGVAFGPDFAYDLGKWGQGTANYYFAADDRPPKDFTGQEVDSIRQRFDFIHRADIETNFTFKTAIRYQSDAFVNRDFFESEYRKNVQPNSFVEVNKSWENWTLNTLVQPQINDFFETVERLPDIRLSGLHQQIGVTPLYYDSESSVGYFQRRFASTNFFQPDFAAFRGDTYHQITWPQNYFGWLNFTPRVGGRLTYYSEASGPGGFTEEQTRGVFNTGAELSTKASRVWKNVENKFFDVNGLRHIFQPSINYVFVPEPNARPRDLPQFDYELPSFRLLPIEFPDYNAIDSIDTQNVLRFHLFNKLQTKREKRVENLFAWDLYTDWRLNPEGTQRTFADLFSDLDFRPRSWISFNSETRFDIHDAEWREANHRITLLPNNNWSLMLGHRYLKEDPFLGEGNNLIYDSFFLRLNENWGFRMTHYFEARNGTMQEQAYTVYRDLRSWTAALTFRVRDSEGSGDDDFAIALTFSLKAFPRYQLGQDSDHPASLLGGW